MALLHCLEFCQLYILDAQKFLFEHGSPARGKILRPFQEHKREDEGVRKTRGLTLGGNREGRVPSILFEAV